MIEYTFNDLDNDCVVSTALWNAYVDIDYGRVVPEKGYKGFKTFLEDVTGADLVTGKVMTGFTLHFNDRRKYLLFLLKWR
jgi:hypothetical protein